MQENETTKQDETETQATDTIEKGFSHTVRHKDGKTVTIKNYSMKKAIALNCSECEGFESDPRNCVDKYNIFKNLQKVRFSKFFYRGFFKLSKKQKLDFKRQKNKKSSWSVYELGKGKTGKYDFK